MIKTLSNILKQDKEKFKVPRKVQDIVPVRTIWPDGIFLVGKNKYSKMYRLLINRTQEDRLVSILLQTQTGNTKFF